MAEAAPSPVLLYLTKIATAFVTPLGAGLVLTLLGAALLAANARRAGLIIILVAASLLWVMSMPVTARLLLGSLERQYPPTPLASTPSADVAIVLGGGISGATPPRQSVELGEASDRVYHAFELLRARKVRAILAVGGNQPWLAASEPEADATRRLLVSWGVAEGDIIIAGASLTTAENATEVAAIWPRRGFTSALLVTSAAHMPRALATFRRAGLPVTPAAADIRAVPEPLDPLDFLPDAKALSDSSAAAREMIGTLVYRLRGDL